MTGGVRMKKYNLTIEKIGRKWIHVKDEYEKQYKLLLDELTKDFEVGETYKVLCKLVDKSTSFGVNRELYAKDEKKVEEERIQSQIKKLEDRLNNSLKWIEKNMEEYWYKNGESAAIEVIEELKEKHNINTKEHENKLEELRSEFKTLQEEKERKKYEWQRRCTKVVGYEYVRYKSDAEGNANHLIGTYIENSEGELMKIKSIDYRFLYKDDAEDVGYSHRNVVEFIAILIDISEDERLNAIKEIEEREKSKKIKKEQVELKKNTLNELKNYILENGIAPELDKKIDGEIIIDEKYGSIIKRDNEIWLLIYNWSDGDDWSLNNIAGMYKGKYVEYEDVADLIKIIQNELVDLF